MIEGNGAVQMDDNKTLNLRILNFPWKLLEFSDWRIERPTYRVSLGHMCCTVRCWANKLGWPIIKAL